MCVFIDIHLKARYCQNSRNYSYLECFGPSGASYFYDEDIFYYQKINKEALSCWGEMKVVFLFDFSIYLVFPDAAIKI